MSLYVQKYGGTSVGSLENIEHVATRVAATQRQGHKVVVIVSAMGGETDRLIDLAYAIADNPHDRELDVLVATGEHVAMALLCIALIKRGLKARSYTGQQARITTDPVHSKAQIEHIDCEPIHADLQSGNIVVVAGFQGADKFGNITTLGRGGSDTTAVALAAALRADECQIYTDVAGVYTTDPHIVPHARLQHSVTFEEMLELSALGAKVLQARAVELIGKFQVPLRVLSTFDQGPGTLITFDEGKQVEQPVISGIAFNRSEAKITVLGAPDRPGIAADIIGPVSDGNIDIDMIVQNIAANNAIDFTFTTNRDEYNQAIDILNKNIKSLGARAIVGDNRIAKLSLVGVGMRRHSGIASKMFKILGAERIGIQMIATSEIKVSVVVDEKYIELAVRALHTAFGLDMEMEPNEEFDPLTKKASGQ